MTKALFVFLCYIVVISLAAAFMRIPKKISPDSLKQAIINIRVIPSIPFEFLAANVYNVLKPDFQYIPGVKQSIPVDPNNPNARLQIGQMNDGIFHNNRIRFQLVSTGNIIFNFQNTYIGWLEYFQQLKKVIEILHREKMFLSFKNIGMRYISEYVNESVFDKIHSPFELEISDKTPIFTGSVLKTEFKEGKRRVVINVADRLERINRNTNSIESFSVIDIDIITPINIVDDIDLLFNTIDESHNFEKEVFFGILTPEYINTLNPEY